MSVKRPNRQRGFRRLVHSWQAPALLGVLLLIAVVVWLMPRRIERIVPADGTSGWNAEQAPPRRQIVWSEARQISSLDMPADQKQQAELITPRLTDGGGTLYFTRWNNRRQADIFRSTKVAGKWQPPEPVKDLNTAADEIGPVISLDGATVYFYSNRRGGLGGYDLYVASQTAAGWSRPENLGPRINTVANEYDPAIAPDGLSLFFSSNRSEDMSNQAGDNRVGSPEWDATLRAPPGKIHFDLFMARRSSAEDQWESVVPLGDLNLPGSNDGAPFVSPNGAFLYFASDRPARPGEAPNLDLYRARLVGERFGKPENLGTTVNTASNETEPALSPEGFTLVFSSNRDGTDRIYISAAQEIDLETAWDASNLHALTNVWWTALWITLLLATLIGLVLYYRGWLAQRAQASRFVLGSIAFHLIILAILAVWTLPKVVQMIVAKYDLADPSTQLFDDNQHQSHEDGREAYEKVADLKSLEATVITKVIRQETSPISVPRRTENLLPTIPPSKARKLPPSRVIFLPPERKAVPPQPRQREFQLARRSTTRASAVVELSDPNEQLVPAPSPMRAEERIEIKVALDRQDVPTPMRTQQPAAIVQRPRDVKRPQPVELKTAVPAKQPPDINTRENPLPARTTRDAIAIRAAVEVAETIELASVAGPSEEQNKPTADPVVVARVAQLMPAARQASTNDGRELPAVQPPAAADPETLRPSLDFDRVTPAKMRNPLKRPVRLPAELAQTETSDEVQLAMATAADETPLLKTAVELSRNGVASISVDVATPNELTGPASRDKHRLIVGTLSQQRNNAPPSFDPLASLLNRRPARASRVAFAADNVGLRSMFTMRQGDTRKQYIKLLGGTEESEKAVNRGLEWLAGHQNPDGSWSLNNFHTNCKNHPRCSGAGSEKSNTAATGLALLPFLAAGHLHNAPGQYEKTVAAAVKWLVDHQKPDGDLLASGDGQHMYSHGIAAIALCEAFGMSRDPELKQPAAKALEFIVKAQHAGSGGWRYSPNQSADTSVVGWQMMALKSGEMAGLPVPKKTLQNVARWLKSVEGNRPAGGTFGYTSRGASPAMTAEGLLCLQFLNIDRNDPRMRAGADYLIKYLPDRKQSRTSYYWYYATQVMYHMQGEYWETWNAKLRDMLVDTQIKQGHMAGTWAPRDSHDKRGGKIYATAMKLLILEVYYRYLPLYDQLDE